MHTRAVIRALLLPALATFPTWLSAAETAPQGLEEMRAFARQMVMAERYEDAIATYITIVEQTPDDPRSQYDVAGIMAFLRMYPDAIPHIEKAIELDPDNTLYLELAALSYLQLRRYEEAFDATLRGAQLGDIKAMYTLAGMYEHGRGTQPSDANALLWLERAARNGHMGAMDAMSRVYRDGLYGQAPDPALERQWQATLEQALAR